MFHLYDIYDNGIYFKSDIRLRNIRFVNQMFITNAYGDIRRGGGKEVAGLYGYTRLGYIQTNFSSQSLDYTLLFGRDTTGVGYGKNAHLFVSEWSRPFDQIRLKLAYKSIQARMHVIQLENMGADRRWLTIHDLKFELPGKFSFTVGEAVIFAGENRGFEFQYLNPMLFWIPEQENPTTGSGNFLLFAGGKVLINPQWSLWAEFLLDDYQYASDAISALEPNELGFLAGTSYQDEKCSGWIEYSRVTNRTYQTLNPDEIFTHRSFPIGHYLGNDFDQWRLHFETKLNGKISVKPYLDLGYIRDGANGLETPFDTPWTDSSVTLETGYSEPFPTRPINYVGEAETGLRFILNKDAYFTVGYYFRREEEGNTVRNESMVTFRLWYERSVQFAY